MSDQLDEHTFRKKTQQALAFLTLRLKALTSPASAETIINIINPPAPAVQQLPVSAQRNTIYWAPDSGDDVAGTGSITRPYKTLEGALSRIKPPTNIKEFERVWRIQALEGGNDTGLAASVLVKIPTGRFIIRGEGVRLAYALQWETKLAECFGSLHPPSLQLEGSGDDAVTATPSYGEAAGAFSIGDVAKLAFSPTADNFANVIYVACKGVQFRGQIVDIIPHANARCFLTLDRCGFSNAPAQPWIGPAIGAAKIQLVEKHCRFVGADLALASIAGIGGVIQGGALTVLEQASTQPDALLGVKFSPTTAVGIANSLRMDGFTNFHAAAAGSPANAAHKAVQTREAP